MVWVLTGVPNLSRLAENYKNHELSASKMETANRNTDFPIVLPALVNHVNEQSSWLWLAQSKRVMFFRNSKEKVSNRLSYWYYARR